MPVTLTSNPPRLRTACRIEFGHRNAQFGHRLHQQLEQCRTLALLNGLGTARTQRLAPSGLDRPGRGRIVQGVRR